MTYLICSTFLFAAFAVFWGPAVWGLLALAERFRRSRRYELMHLVGSLTPVASGIAIACLICSFAFFGAFFWPVLSGA